MADHLKSEFEEPKCIHKTQLYRSVHDLKKCYWQTVYELSRQKNAHTCEHNGLKIIRRQWQGFWALVLHAGAAALV